MSGLLQLAGALIILCAFVAVQSGRAQPRSRVTLAMNLIGSAVLAVLALAGSQWGFLLLEASWATVSAAGLVRSTISRAGQPSYGPHVPDQAAGTGCGNVNSDYRLLCSGAIASVRNGADAVTD